MEARLKRLERLNKILFAGLAMALVPWIVGAGEKIPELIQGTSGKFQTVSAAHVMLIDDAGNKFGDLSALKDNSNLTIEDSNGKSRLFLGMFKGNPTLLFADKNGHVVASYAEKDGSFETVKGN
jgi:hypothetical protein